MLAKKELIILLEDMESDRVERKRSISDKEKICEAICAFANDLPDHRQPGIVFVGVEDDGDCANLAITDELLQTLSAIKTDGNIVPFPSLTVQKIVLNDCELAVVQVEPADGPPVRYRGRVWVRVGPRRATATSDDERRLIEKRRSGTLPFDHHVVRGATLNDLDLVLFERVYLPSAVAVDVLLENDRPLEQQLASLHFLGQDKTPNVAGLLVLGKDPRSWIPGSYVQFVRFEGTELTDAIRHQHEITGPLPEILRMMDEILEANISVATEIPVSGPELRRPDYLSLIHI